jgi:hypothetical protein
MFLGLLDPDPIFRGTDMDPSMIKQNLDSYCFATSLLTLFFKNAVNVPSNSNTQKNVEKNSFLLASGRSMTKIAGPGAESGYGAGSISQRQGSADRGSGSGTVPKCPRSPTLVVLLPENLRAHLQLSV